jgi:prevent-host-death family protein
MPTAAVTELKASLSEYLAKVKAGEEVLVTERGRPVAKIVPIARGPDEIAPHLLALERAGLVRIGSGQLTDEFWDRRKPVDSEGAALRALRVEREEGR